MDRIAFVCVNYGKDIVGGSQSFTRLTAEHLTKYYDVEILTSNSIDTWSWRNHYSDHEEILNGVLVRRFDVDKERDESFIEIQSRFLQDDKDDTFEEAWIESVGPHSPALIEYISKNKDKYKVFIFVTYEYYHAVKGLPAVKEKAIFIPTAHDCHLIRHRLFADLFNYPKAFVYLTEEEKQLCNLLFHNEYIDSKVLGVGVDIPSDLQVDNFKNKYGLDRYILYVGRIEEGKGCGRLFADFLDYKQRNDNDLTLAIIGKGSMEIPESRDIRYLGFVEDKEKFEAMSGADFLILPSEFESLSMVVLEAMAVRTPVIVNSRCAVLKGHCLKSNGGLYYNGYYELESILNYFSDHPGIYSVLCDNAYDYVQKNYNWDNIVSAYCDLINKI